MTMRESLLAFAVLATAACGPGGGTDAGTDVPQSTDHVVADVPGTDVVSDTPAGDGSVSDDCATYCAEVTTHCTGDNIQYTDMADCMTFCAAAGWPVGTANDMAGDTLGCRVYHAGAPAAGDPVTHCPHAGPTGAGVCGTPTFRTDAASTYTRVDRMGMPAVSTALVPAGMKNAYNDADPAGDMSFAGTFVATLTGLHTALDADLNTLHLQPCSMTTMVGGLPECLGQTYGGTSTVASLIVPHDTLTLDTTVAAGFPNGRMLADPVIDVTLGVLLLKLNGGTCGTGTAACTAATLAMIPLNPAHNDVTNLTTFPYLALPHTP